MPTPSQHANVTPRRPEHVSPEEKAREFDEIAEQIFRPVYGVLAEQIRKTTGIGHGHCLDIGCGGGHLGLNLALQTRCQLTLVDLSAPALALAQARAAQWGIEAQRLQFVPGDVHQLPLADASMDLCISRGSLWFWENSEQAFSEILRVLKPGGQAYIGSGFGNAELKAEVDQKMRQRDPSWPARPRQFQAGHTPEKYHALLGGLPAVAAHQIIQDERGFWLHFSRRLPETIKVCA